MGMALDEPQENEQPVTVNGIEVLMADFARPYAEGVVVDYVTNPYSEGFIIDGAGRC
jgi:Fe-S cluster assembly iron-binding protein IscA